MSIIANLRYCVYLLALETDVIVVDVVTVVGVVTEVVASCKQLLQAYYPSYQGHFLKSVPQWNESKIIAVMQKLVKAESGFLIYDDLCKEHGRSVIDSMIEHNILHLRPTNYCSFDLPSQPKHKAIVTAESACGRIAMEDVLKELGK